MAIVKKNISNAAIDGLKLLLLNNQPVKARNSLGTAVELFKLDDEDSLRFAKIPKVAQAPSESQDLANKQYVDGLIASVPSVHLKIVELSAQDISNQYIDLDIQANPDSLIIAAESRVMLFNGIDFSHSVVGGLSRLSFAGSIAEGEPEALEQNEKLYVWSYPASGFSVSGGGGGYSVLNGAGAPSLALGSVGDFYINTSDFSIYGPKAVTGWGSPVSLVGPAGAQGEQGEIGPVGPQGEVGPQGPQGEVGPVGAQGEAGPEGPQGPQGETGTFDYTLLGQPNGVAPLNAEGKIDAQFYSSIAITDVFVVADIAERDALTVESGDVAKVLDSGDGQANTFIYSGSAWVEMETSSEVLSVNSKTGSVVLNTSDIAESGATNRYFTPAREAAIEAAIEAEEEARALADNSLEGRLDVLEGSGAGSVAKAQSDAQLFASNEVASEAQTRLAADNALDSRVTTLENEKDQEPLEFWVLGDYTVGGAVQNSVMIERLPYEVNVISAALLLNIAGTSGTLRVDVKRSSDGITWTSIFSTKPSVASSAGNYAQATNQNLVSPSINIPAGNLLRLDIESVQGGQPNGFLVQLLCEVV